MKFALLLIVLYTCVIGCGSRAYAADWQEYRSENFTVYSDAKPKYVQQQIRDFEVYRLGVLTFLGLDNRPENKKARIYIFDKTKEFQEYAGSAWIAGFYRYQLNGPTMVMSRLKQGRGQSGQTEQNLVLFHEYVHYLLRERGGVNYPRWYEEGLSDLLGAAKIEKEKVGIGASNPWRHSAARGQTLLKVEDLVAPPQLTNWRQTAGFYPSSWLLTHYLILGHLGGEPDYSSKLREYLLAYAHGAVTVAEFEKVMGVNTQTLDKALELYTRKSHLLGYSIPVKPYSGDIRQRKLADNEVLYHKADLLVGADRASRARKILEESRKGKPFYFENLSFRAVLLSRIGEHQQANAFMEEALAANSDESIVLIGATQVLIDQLEAKRSSGQWDDRLYARAHDLAFRAYRNSEDNLLTVKGLWRLYELKGDPLNAEKMMMELYQAAPGSIEVNYQIAQSLVNEGSLEAALPFLNRLFLLSHDDVFKNEIAEQINIILQVLAELNGKAIPEATDNLRE